MWNQRGAPLLPTRGVNESAEAFLDRLMPVLHRTIGNGAPPGIPDIRDNQGRVIFSGRGLYAYGADGSLPIAPNVVQIDTQHLVDAAVELAKLDQDQVVTCTPKVIAGDIVTLSLLAGDLEAVEARIGNLKVNRANIANAAIGSAQIEDAAITNAKIANAAIDNAKISDVSADKLTAGTIDATNINVTNLNADNITAGSINTPRIASGAVSSITRASGGPVTLTGSMQDLLTFTVSLQGDGLYALLYRVHLSGNNGYTGAGKFGARAVIQHGVLLPAGGVGGSAAMQFGSATADDAEDSRMMFDGYYASEPGNYVVTISGRKDFGNTVTVEDTSATLFCFRR